MISNLNTIKRMMMYLTASLFYLLTLSAHAELQENLHRLQAAYPEYIKSFNENEITWQDGTTMSLQQNKTNKTWQEKLTDPSLFDQLTQAEYPEGKLRQAPSQDPGRIRYEPFFRKMYGETKADVEKNLTTIYWLPNLFGKRYPLLVTTINNVDKQLSNVSAELEILVKQHPKFMRYLRNPGGAYLTRKIAHTKRLSPHSFGMTMDINSEYANYWQWDLAREKKPISEYSELQYQNNIPWEIVTIFEKNGFIWGGKWYHYDTMHFEYRPELITH